MTNTITKEEIKQKLCKHYGANPERRRMIETPIKNNYGMIGSIVYSINGSPPKGYGLYVPSHRHLSLYDLHGKRYRIMREVEVER